MVIGIDASRMQLSERSGTENYSYNLIKNIIRIDTNNRYVLYFSQHLDPLDVYPNVSSKVLRSKFLWTQVRLAAECFIKPPDILFIPAHTPPLITRPGLKTIVTIHGLESEFVPSAYTQIQRLYLKLNLSIKADHMIAVSKSTKKDLTRSLKVLDSRVSVVHEGVDKDFFSKKDDREVRNVRLKYGIKDKYFLYVGTIQPRKNLSRLIEAFAKLSVPDVDLVLVGRSGWLYGDIYKAPKKFKVEENVKFLGFAEQEDLPALYTGSTAFVMPSLYEGFGLPILEAMACGAPVLTSKSSSLPEVSGSHALLIKPHSVNDIAYNLSRLLKEESLRWKLSAAGQEWVKIFSWEKTAKETIEVFEKVYKKG